MHSSYSGLAHSIRSIQGSVTPPGKGDFEILKRQITDFQDKLFNFGCEMRKDRGEINTQLFKVAVENVTAIQKCSRENDVKIEGLRREFENERTEVKRWREAIEGSLDIDVKRVDNPSHEPCREQHGHKGPHKGRRRS
jgi:hypothetical protein